MPFDMSVFTPMQRQLVAAALQGQTGLQPWQNRALLTAASNGPGNIGPALNGMNGSQMSTPLNLMTDEQKAALKNARGGSGAAPTYGLPNGHI
jgi:hypothetical protein